MTGSATGNKAAARKAFAGKVSYDPALDTKAMFARAEQALSELKADYFGVVDPEAEKLAQICRKVRTEPAAFEGTLAELHAACFELKGQAGTFGYTLITDIGESLCRFISTIDSPDADRLDVLQVHVDALRLVIRERMQGDGGAPGRHLLTSLQSAIDKIAA